MMRFVFSLQSVLQLRIHAEQHRQRELAAAQARVAQLERQIRHLESQLVAADDELHTCLRAAPLDPAQLAVHARYKHALTLQIEQLQADLQQACQSVDQAKAQLVSATTQRKSLEKLRERQHEQFTAAQHKREHAAHDDLATRRIAKSA